MKILMLNYPYLADELRQLGAEVISAGLESDCDIVCSKSDYHLQYILGKIDFKPDFILFMDSLNRRLPEGLEESPCPLGAYFIDSTLNSFWQRPFSEMCSLVLTDQLPEAEEYTNLGMNAHWLPLAADDSIYIPMNLDKKYDLCFIGSRHSANRIKRDNILDRLDSRFNIKIFDGNPPVTAEQAARIYNQSRITLNENLFPAVNLRLFEVMACDTVVLTEETAPGLNKLFQDEKHLLTYNPDNLIDKVDYYLKQHDELQRIADESSRLILEKHTLKKRAEELLFLLNECIENGSIPLHKKQSAAARAMFWFDFKFGDEQNPLIQSALNLLGQASEIEASYEDMLALGQMYFFTNDYNSALRQFNSASHKCCDAFLPRYFAGSALTQSGELYLAGKYFKLAADLACDDFDGEPPIRPETEAFHVFWGHIFERVGDILEPGLMKYRLPMLFWSALEHYHRAAEINPRNWEKVGDLLMEFKAPDQALAAFKAAVPGAPDEKIQRAEKESYLHVSENNIPKYHLPTLSLCMIVKNEADNLRELMPLLSGIPDQMVIADTGSDDDTIKVAEQFGAEVIIINWSENFAEARNQTLARARGDYILYLDGDDRIDPEELKSVKNLLPATDDSIFLVRLMNEHNDEVCLQKRIFPNRLDLRFQGAIHEQINPDPAEFKFYEAPMTITHLGYSDGEALTLKSQRNLNIILKELNQNPDDYHLRYDAAVCLLNLDRGVEAVDQLKHIAFNDIVREKFPELYEHSLIMIAKIFRRMGDTDTSLKLMGNLITDLPESANGHYFLGKIYFEEQLYNECRLEMEYFLSRNIEPLGIPIPVEKMKGWANYYLARCHEHLGHLDKASEEYTEAMKYLPDTAKLYGDIGRTFYKNHDYESALHYLNLCIEKHPGDRNAQKLLKRVMKENVG